MCRRSSRNRSQWIHQRVFSEARKDAGKIPLMPPPSIDRTRLICVEGLARTCPPHSNYSTACAALASASSSPGCMPPPFQSVDLPASPRSGKATVGTKAQSCRRSASQKSTPRCPAGRGTAALVAVDRHGAIDDPQQARRGRDRQHTPLDENQGDRPSGAGSSLSRAASAGPRTPTVISHGGACPFPDTADWSVTPGTCCAVVRRRCQ